MGDRKAVGRFEVIYIIIQMERFLGHILIGVIQLNSESEGAVFLHRRSHEESPWKKKGIHFKIERQIDPLTNFPFDRFKYSYSSEIVRGCEHMESESIASIPSEF